MAQKMVQITRSGSTVTFTPSTQPITSLDILTWANNDEQQQHWPAPNASQPTAWMPAAIPAKLPGQPAPTSRGLTFAPGTYNLSYVCALHPTEKGVIQVTS